MKKYLFVFLWCLTISSGLFAQFDDMQKVKGGVFTPLYGVDSLQVKIDAFLLDTYPVSNEAFLEFVVQNPKWRKSEVPKLFADGNYLKDWKGDVQLAEHLLPNAPVTNISWFAAKNYCESKGKRLPTVDEWEFAAMADQNSADARKMESYNQFILEWYETPNSFNKPIGSTFKNFYGIYDLHGLVWEWTSDFNSVLISGESRQDVDKDSKLFCGSAAVGASDLMNYAAFMRYAFRGSMKASYSVKNLGFRCAKDIDVN